MKRPLHGAPLTDRQFECLALAGQGLRNQDIADRLNLSVNTVKYHMRYALARSGARNRRVLAIDAPECRRVWVPQRVNTFRKAAGLTWAQLGARVYLSAGAVGDYASGSSMPRADTLARLADALGRSVEDFYDAVPVESGRRAE